MTEDEKNQVIADFLALQKKPKNDIYDRIIEVASSKLCEQGTWRGVIALLPLCGATFFGVDTSQAEDILMSAMAAFGAHNIATKG